VLWWVGGGGALTEGAAGKVAFHSAWISFSGMMNKVLREGYASFLPDVRFDHYSNSATESEETYLSMSHLPVRNPQGVIEAIQVVVRLFVFYFFAPCVPR